MPGVGRGAWETLGSRASRSSRRSAPRLQSADRAVLAPWARGGNRRVTLRLKPSSKPTSATGQGPAGRGKGRPLPELPPARAPSLSHGALGGAGGPSWGRGPSVPPRGLRWPRGDGLPGLTHLLFRPRSSVPPGARVWRESVGTE